MDPIGLISAPTLQETQAGGVQARLLSDSLAGAANNVLGKDDFLKILLVQLTNQDPTQPMQDREFIAQMAQFSTLEQMTNMTSEMADISGLLARTEALALVGKTVQITSGESFVTGTVDAVTGGDLPQILVDGRYYDATDVTAIVADAADVTLANAGRPATR